MADIFELANYKGGKPSATIDNVAHLLNLHKIQCRYNVISKEVEITIPDTSYSLDNQFNATLAHIQSLCAKHGLPDKNLDNYLLTIADMNQYNPVKEWIESKPWDGVNRYDEFFKTITAVHEDAKEWFLFHWMLGAVASAMNPDGFDSPGIIVLQGSQGIGKTWWFRKLCPELFQRDSASIDPTNKDTVEQVIGYWLVELGELDGTFKRAEIASLKAFITRKRDTLRKSYAKRASTYPRRTVFCATVNDHNFLHDKENRRFWTIECLKINSYHDIDIQQLWAQVYEDWKAGESPILTAKAQDKLKEINEDHQQLDPIYEMLLQKYDWSNSMIADWKIATAIAREIDIRYPTKRDINLVSEYVMKLNGNQKKKSGSFKYLLVPPIK